MAQAKIENAGKILLGNQIVIGSPSLEKPYMCVYLRNTWTWQQLDKVSGKTLKRFLPAINSNILRLIENQEQTALRIEIKGAPLEFIDGEYTPVTCINGEIIYSHRSSPNYWLYAVKTNGKSQWWLGNAENKNLRRGWGWLREVKQTDAHIDPWMATSWKWYDSAERKWTTTHTMQIKTLTREQIVELEVIKRTKILDEAFNAKIVEYKKKTEAAEQHASAHTSVSRMLFNNLSQPDRLQLVDKAPFRAIFRREDLCSVCFSKDETTKCIHSDCTGACAKCRGDDHDKTCCACKKEQILTCPICLDKYPPSFINRFPCHHGVCWKCHCHSYEAKKPIINCPLCRKKI